MSSIVASLPSSASVPVSASRASLIVGRVLSAIAILFLGLDAVMKLFLPPVVVQASAELGFTEHTAFAIGVILFVCVVAYSIPRTAVLGAVLLTGYLGGAIATHVRFENPLFTHILFPLDVAAFVWGGLVLRDRSLLRFLPLTRR